MKSLKALQHALADAGHQIDILEHEKNLPAFSAKMKWQVYFLYYLLSLTSFR